MRQHLSPSGKASNIRRFSCLIMMAVAINAGYALAGGKEIAQPKAQNRAKLMQYHNKMQRAYEGAAKKLKSAKYLEDVHKFKRPRSINKRTPGPITAANAGQVASAVAQSVAQQVSAQVTQQLMGQKRLSPDEKKHLQNLKQKADQRHSTVKKLVKQRTRELRTKRRPLKGRK